MAGRFRHVWTSCFLLLCSSLAVAAPDGGAEPRSAFVTIATDDYYAHGALVALHSVWLHARPSGTDVEDFDRILMVASPGISRKWRRRFIALGVRLVDVTEVMPSLAVGAAMEADRKKLEREGLLDVLQPVPYGGAFSKIHAWDPAIFGAYGRVVLLDGDVVAKRDVRGLLEMKPLAASRDLMDAFNYGVIVLRPDAAIHRELVSLLTEASQEDVKRYNTRKAQEVGFCDQTLVAGYLAAHHGPVNFFEDAHPASRTRSQRMMLSSEYNLVVSYRAKERCDDLRERRSVNESRIVHFANNWLHFAALARDRDAPGRIDSPRCYQGAFHYWHDVYKHALAKAGSPSKAAGTKGGEDLSEPVYVARSGSGATSADVQRVFDDFHKSRPLASTRWRGDL